MSKFIIILAAIGIIGIGLAIYNIIDVDGVSNVTPVHEYPTA